MVQASTTEIKIPSLHQIGIVVEDVDKTAHDYRSSLDIGPWDILTLRPPDVSNLTYRGKPAYFEFKRALAQAGPVEIELSETLKGHTHYMDFMAEHGEGAHHLQYLVDSVDVMDKHIEIMTEKGFHSLMGGRRDNGGFEYLDTVSALKTVWEIAKMPDKPSTSAIQYPLNDAETSPTKVKVGAIMRVGIVVENLEEVMENYWTVVGIGPWEVFELVPPVLHGQTYCGKPSDFTMRLALAMAGLVQIELVQPLAGNNVYSDFLAEHGEGLHHIQFTVNAIDETAEIMNRAGFTTLMSWRVGDAGFAYYDTAERLKCIWGAYEVGAPLSPVNRYP